MSTRGIIGFVHRGVVKATYNHSDSYPDYMGKEVAEYAAGIEDVEALGELVHKLVPVEEGDSPTEGQRELLAQFTEHVGDNPGADWYSVLRGTQGDLDATVKSGFIIDSASFAQDSLFCEYGYLVNLDAETLEFYKGFVHSTDPCVGRFAALPGQTSGYRPITLVAEFTFEQLRSTPVANVVKVMQKAAGEDED